MSYTHAMQGIIGMSPTVPREAVSPVAAAFMKTGPVTGLRVSAAIRSRKEKSQELDEI